MSSSKETQVSLVTSMYNSNPATVNLIEKLFFPSLLNNLSSRTQLVIVDDASPLKTETQKMVDRFMPDFKSRAGNVIFQRSSQNSGGFAPAYNYAVSLAEGPVVAMVNDDIYLPRQAISSMVEVLTSDPQSGAVGPVLNNVWTFQGINLFPPLKDLSLAELSRIDKFSNWLKQVMSGQKYLLSRPSVNLVGACLVFRKKVWDQVSGLDEHYRYGLFEDADWGRKVKQAGYHLVVDAATFVEHGGPQGGSTSLKQQSLKHLEGMVKNTLKYGNKWKCLTSLPFDLLKMSLQSSGRFSIQSEIIHHARQKNLWPLIV